MRTRLLSSHPWLLPSFLLITHLKRLKQVSLNKVTLYLLLVSWVEESLKHHHWLYGRLSRTHYPDIFMTTCSRYFPLSVFTSWWDEVLRLPCRRQNSRREKLGYEQLAERNAIVGVWVKYVIERPRSSGPRAGRFVRSHCALEKSMFRNTTGYIANAQFDRRET